LSRAELNPVALRVVSAAVLAPIPLAAIWFGEPWLAVLAALAGGGMAWEWGRLCQDRAWSGSGGLLIGIVVGAVIVGASRGVAEGVAVAGIGSALVWMLAAGRREAEPAWLAFGAIWIAVPCVLLLWLARPEAAGRATVLWLFAVVWATDIGAYVFGRAIGGPRLAPTWSPNKTWAGLLGGAICAGIVGWVAAFILDSAPTLPLVAASAGLAIVEQFGDLAESMAKRRFGVKDSGGLIPGHGGLLDRLDGLLAVIPAVALLTLVGGGVPTWR
jgi:phosphatidate cytidylyltransferase